MSTVIPNSEFLNIDNPTNPKNKITIQIRKFDASFAEYCKSKGLTVGFEVSDNMVTDYLYGRVNQDDFARYTNKFCDFYIVNNDITKEGLSKVTDKKIYVIPHHNCNFSKTKNVTSKKPKTIGYIGVPDYTIKPNIIQDICIKNNLNFFIENPLDYKNLQLCFQKIDIGIVFFEKDSIKDGIYERTLKYKPNTKLTNFQSYGIPTICLPYESYKQFGENKCIFVETLNELNFQIENLCNNQDLYQNLSLESIKVGEKYHISNVKENYLQIVKDFQ